MTAQAERWFSFGAALFFFMGLGWALDPETPAKSLIEWPSSKLERFARRIVLAYRLAGIALAALGLGVALCVRLFPERLAPYSAPHRERLWGAVLLLLGLGLAGLKLVDWKAPARKPAALACGWMVVVSLLFYGASMLKAR